MALLGSRLGSRPRAALFLVSMLGPAFSTGLARAQSPQQAAAPNVTDAKASLTNGDKAARAKDWPKAQAEYDAAQKAQPSAEALEGLANAHYQQMHDTDAYAAYDAWLKTYGAKASAAKKTQAEARMKEIAGRTGLLAIDASEAGAAVAVDDKPMGTTPLAAPLRLPAGPHRVRITKDGFMPIDQVPNVTAGATSTLAAKFAAQSNKGRLTVREKNGKPIRVVIDGVDMGEAPWSGDVAAGAHDVAGRSPSIAAAPEKVDVEAGKTREVELVASSTTATLKVTTSDGKGLIHLDGKVVGEGAFTSEIPAGTHTLRITRDGYDPFEEPIALKDKETLARSVTLKLSSKIATGPVQKERRGPEGIYGGVSLLATYLTSGMQSSMQRTCEGNDKPAELASCDGVGGGVGGGLTGFFGYHWDPVGVELFLGAQYDQSSPTLNWQASSVDPGVGPDPARTESFSIHRLGGFGILRMRFTLQSERLRFTVAGGVGLSVRSVFMSRDTTQVGAPQNHDVFVPGPEGYSSPIVSLEPSLHYRLSSFTSIGIGLSILAESTTAFDKTPTTKKEANHFLGTNALTTPSYELASGTQVFIGPIASVMFGP